VIPADYHELFSALAETAATLTGLLFVAISLAPDHDPNSERGVIQQVRAAAAFLAFTNTLAVTIYGLIPGNSIATPATVLGVIGILFTAAGARSIFARRSDGRSWKGQLGLLTILLLIFGFELEAGITLLVDRHNAAMYDRMSDILLASLLMGVARSWELAGHRQTGVLSSLTVLAGRNTKEPPEQEPGRLDHDSGQPTPRPGTPNSTSPG
jgi:hypothetical protein